MSFQRSKLTAGFAGHKRLIQALLAEDIGDDTAGGDVNVQAFLDARRPFQGVLANTAALPAIPPAAGQFYLVRDAGGGEAAFYVSTGASWDLVSGGSGGGFDAAWAPVRAVATAQLAGAYTAPGLIEGVGPLDPGDLDGVLLALGDSVLVPNQGDATQNGIYTLTQEDPFILSRRADASDAGGLTGGRTVVATEGSLYADTMWLLATDGPVVVDTTPLYWSIVGVGGTASPLPDSVAKRGADGALYALPPGSGYGDPGAEGAALVAGPNGEADFYAIPPLTLSADTLGGLPGTTVRHLELGATLNDGVFQHFDLAATGLPFAPAEVAGVVRHTNNGWWQRVGAPATSGSEEAISFSDETQGDIYALEEELEELGYRLDAFTPQSLTLSTLNVLAGASAQVDFPVQGVLAGDVAAICPFEALPPSLSMQALCPSDGVVRVRFFNPTSGPVATGAGDLRVAILGRT